MERNPNAGERLDGWDAISAYLGWHSRTVMRWEEQKGLPVHRVPGGKRQPVYAYKHELDRWYSASKSLGLAEPDVSAISPQSDKTLPVDESAQVEQSATGKFGFRTALVAGIALMVSIAIVLGLRIRYSTLQLSVSGPKRVTQSQTRILSPLLLSGDKVYFPEYENNQYTVGEVPANGGQSSTVATSVTNPELCDIAKHSQAMLLRSLVGSRDQLAPLYVQSKDKASEKVGNILAYDAAWYPDEERILYSAENGVYSTDRKGSPPLKLFDLPGNAFWFRWAPDGGTIRFTVIDTKTEQTSIWEASNKGENPHQLFLESHSHLCCGTWTPDGRFYVFQARVGNSFEVWGESELSEGLFSTQRKVSPLLQGAMNYRGPSVSGDGRKLFLRAETPKSELVRYDKTLATFIPFLPSLPARTLAFSKDGSRLAYTSLADNQLWRCSSDGIECMQLTQGFKQTVMPRWSPDGQTIVFMGLPFAGAWEALAISEAGGTVRSLSDVSRPQGDPDWSPDGRKLVFGDVLPVSSPRGIYVFDLASNKALTLKGSEGFFSPRWSPDGRCLVALHAGDQHLYRFDFASAKWALLAAVSAGYPAFSHDGKYVYFLSSGPGTRAVFRVSLFRRNIDKVADLTRIEKGSYFMSDWIGLTAEDTPLAIHDLTTEDIYSWNLVPR